MHRSDFHFDLPPELIAQQPLPERSGSRLLVLDPQEDGVQDRLFPDLLQLLDPSDLLIFNNTRVMRARIHARKETGGRVELLVERLIDSRNALVHIRSSKSPKEGSSILLPDGIRLTVTGRHGELFELHGEDIEFHELMNSHGHIPLPPYIQRPDNAVDEQRYQTVYARREGAVAAPTAGLHFDQALLAALKEKGIRTAEVTLHVGAGTFQPVRVDDLDRHVMHSEWLEVNEQVCDAVAQTRARGGRVVAVGTTSVRSLETASAADGVLRPYRGDTRLFIKPGYRFHVVDALITNFHLPESTLLMLVSAFAGYDRIMSAYRHAVEHEYRFFSYGDAMFLSRDLS